VLQVQSNHSWVNEMNKILAIAALLFASAAFAFPPPVAITQGRILTMESGERLACELLAPATTLDRRVIMQCVPFENPRPFAGDNNTGELIPLIHTTGSIF